MRHGHAEAVLPVVDRVMREAGHQPGAIDIVGVSTGPGGFTGIRVGLAAAHGIALATRARLAGITVFAAIAAKAGPGAPRGCEALLVAVDSRRDELYVQLFSREAVPLAEPAALLSGDLPAYIARVVGDSGLQIAGDASDAAALALAGRPRLSVASASACDAPAVGMAAARLLRAGKPLPPARPFYLRPPDVTLAKRPPPTENGSL